MIDPFGFVPFPDPAPYHGQKIAIEVQREHFAMPSDHNGGPIQWRATGNCRLILTGSAEKMQPYLDAVKELWDAETDG
jgi:hypothetical protein